MQVFSFFCSCKSFALVFPTVACFSDRGVRQIEGNEHADSRAFSSRLSARKESCVQ